MLYDILIIDDDFSGESVFDDLVVGSENHSSWHKTIMPLYFELTRENLKVIWSTGEIDDLEKLENHQISKVKHVICDLHLTGINDNSDVKNIIGKIAGILDKLDKNLSENSISFLINSKYIDQHSSIKDGLQKMLNKSYPNKYTVAVFSEKNVITPEQKQELVGVSLLSHIKEQIIKKHLEVEYAFGEKIGIEDDVKEEVLKELAFSSKHKIVKKTFNLNENNTKISKFNESRNHIAHTEINAFVDLQGNSTLKKLKCFSDLTSYIEEIDHLIIAIKNAQRR